MTSSRTVKSDCFVYITLPGTTAAVTAGRFELSPDKAGHPLGRFVYGRSYLARPDAVELDPVELRLATSTYSTAGHAGVFGAIRDAGPDYWGRRVIDRHAGRSPLSELDYLLHSPDDRAGALGFGLNSTPPAPRRDFNKTLDLQKLQAIADMLLDESPAQARGFSTADATQVEELLLIGTSMGGARPKAVVEDDEGLWVAKFNRQSDRINMARVEHAMLTLARTCGISAASSRVISVSGRDVLLVKRFDRERTDEGYERARMVSALTLLRADETASSHNKWSYLALVEELRRASATPDDDAPELFRRACFNALISNTDDHPKNHAIIARERSWRLSPAYDLTPSTPVSVERRDLAMTIGDAGRYANATNLISQSRRFLLEPESAAAVIDEMEQQVRSTWYGTARAEGVSEADCEFIRLAFVYPGFRLPIPKE